MNTNLKNKEEIQEAFKDLFEFEDEKEEIKHRARILMFRFLSEVEKIVEKKKLKKKDLAKMIGTSPSYVTQLFRGDKLINLETLAKLQKVLGIEFVIKSKKVNTENSKKRVPQKNLLPKQKKSKYLV
ncbi:helix-turn-helix domain-containing protein [Catalinimonas niigatensis]|uniref:helix-turn-helix domain-containing protein n=1 Tax=Catalinimonas niigatensis TaxID=1397264 RepID=UPI0026666863|nr:helix-turn-helix transcriptional regulator [Catalinimonas niigatensis]WPP53600.1 helix-turn-helix transcriptional regulator [Catalinimonas niigatensis]